VKRSPTAAETFTPANRRSSGTRGRGCAGPTSTPSRTAAITTAWAGVVVALELLRSAHEDGVTIPLELVEFAEEEGPDLGLGMIGSRAWVGELDLDRLQQLRNAAGQTYYEAGRAHGVWEPGVAPLADGPVATSG